MTKLSKERFKKLAGISANTDSGKDSKTLNENHKAFGITSGAVFENPFKKNNETDETAVVDEQRSKYASKHSWGESPKFLETIFRAAEAAAIKAADELQNEGFELEDEDVHKLREKIHYFIEKNAVSIKDA